MATAKNKKNRNRLADRFYDYLISRKGTILRYISAALITGLIEFLLPYFRLTDETIAMVIRLTLLFTLAKYWVYREFHKPIFHVLRQIMLAVMVLLLIETVIFFLINALAMAIGSPTLIVYIGKALLEVLIFITFQFLIFTEKKD